MPSVQPTTSPPILSIGSLNRLVRECLENTFPLTWVQGEISNLTYAASGHVYFTLKDTAAQVRCVMWRSRAQTIGWRLENGQKVEARALISFYEPRGEFQLSVENIRRAGQGDLFERFLRLKAQLESEGLFAPESKRPLPVFPTHLAIVTSLQAAALRDVLSTLHRRAPHVRITLIPTPVQGEGASEKIANAINTASQQKCDVLLLCRGGGSIEDLWAFNEECVARAIRASAIPVISGIGHETDFTIADFAADIRAPTPTAAAEMACPSRETLIDRLAQLKKQLDRCAQRNIDEQQQQLDWLSSRLSHPTEKLHQQAADIRRLIERLTRAATLQQTNQKVLITHLEHRLQNQKPQMQQHELTLKQLHSRLKTLLRWQISQHTMKLNAASSGLKQLDPQAVLARGYTLVTGQDGLIVRDASPLQQGDALKLSFAHGSAAVTVNEVVAAAEAD
jgi:exodeoxyribonuclease VII large subunit